VGERAGDASLHVAAEQSSYDKRHGEVASAFGRSLVEGGPRGGSH
jgi:hypothetical protein